MKLARLVGRLATSLGVVVVKKDHPSLRYLTLPPYSGFIYAVQRAFSDLTGRRFIQVGANDGRREDPLHQLIRQLGWTGTLIEPRGIFCAQLRRLYGDRPDLRIVPAAIAETCTQRTLYHLSTEAAHLPDFAAGLATLDRQRIVTACRDLGIDPGLIREETIEALRWRDLEPATNLAATEILVLDTEGYDAVLLRLWPWSQCRPAVVHFEHACLSGSEYQATLYELRECGYEIVTDGADTTAFLPSC